MRMAVVAPHHHEDPTRRSDQPVHGRRLDPSRASGSGKEVADLEPAASVDALAVEQVDVHGTAIGPNDQGRLPSPTTNWVTIGAAPAASRDHPAFSLDIRVVGGRSAAWGYRIPSEWVRARRPERRAHVGACAGTTAHRTADRSDIGTTGPRSSRQ